MYNAQHQDWALWFQAQGVEPLGRQTAGGPSFDDQTLLNGAALSSQGVALVTEALASPESKRGRLVAGRTQHGRRNSPIGWSVHKRPRISRR